MRMVFHYAPWATVPAIVESACLRPSNAGAPGEVPLLWFSANQSWEPTATKMVGTAMGPYQLTLQEQIENFGCVRFGLPESDPRLRPWRAACKIAGIGEMTRRKLERVGVKRGGTPAHWFALECLAPLPELTFEVLANSAWYPADPAEMAEVWVVREREQPAA